MYGNNGTIADDTISLKGAVSGQLFSAQCMIICGYNETRNNIANGQNRASHYYKYMKPFVIGLPGNIKINNVNVYLQDLLCVVVYIFV